MLNRESRRYTCLPKGESDDAGRGSGYAKREGFEGRCVGGRCVDEMR